MCMNAYPSSHIKWNMYIIYFNFIQGPGYTVITYYITATDAENWKSLCSMTVLIYV